MYDIIKKEPSSYSKDFRKEVLENYKSICHLYQFQVKNNKTGKISIKKSRHWHEPKTIEHMANEIGLKKHYDSGYRPLSWIEHANPTDTLLKAKTGIIKFEPTFDKMILTEALLLNFSYFRYICESVNGLFHLDQGGTLKQFAKELKELENKYRKGN
jgi:hypothetical protein